MQTPWLGNMQWLSPATQSDLHVCAWLPRPFQIWAHPIYYVPFPNISSWIQGSQICSDLFMCHAHFCFLAGCNALTVRKGGSENSVIVHMDMSLPQLLMVEVSSSPPCGLGSQGFRVRLTQDPILFSSRTRVRHQDCLVLEPMLFGPYLTALF